MLAVNDRRGILLDRTVFYATGGGQPGDVGSLTRANGTIAIATTVYGETKADIIHADGQPVVIASRLLTDTPIPERTATTDFIHDASRKAREHNLRFFLFGSTEDVNAACAGFCFANVQTARVPLRGDEEARLCR